MSQPFNVDDVVQNHTQRMASGGLKNLSGSNRKRSQPDWYSLMSDCQYAESDYELLNEGFGTGNKRQKIDTTCAYTAQKAKVNEAWMKANEVDLDDML